ncbi:MAG TPA: lysophospholipid acyltransferase family protein [Alphaproteobacteria bacterium]|nr:lysophospholipid acyltransferase family protein [Alphaproteobacteria bacterium]
MTALRSLLFNLAFYGWTALACVVALPMLVLPRGVLVRLARLWVRGIVLQLAVLLNLRHEVRGENPQPKGGAIYAFKHQSAWDTLLLPLLLRDPAIVLKKELLLIPLFGWYLAKTGQIAIDRRGGAKALKRMVRAAARCIRAGRPLVIFPEGTRTAPGQHRPYLPGVAALYGQLALPVVPVALNSGLFWPRRSFLKRPGLMTVEFLPAIEPGLSRQAFLDELERRTEGACRRLLATGERARGGR